MADVFISYAKEDRDFAVRLSRAFEAIGWSVWWDRKLFVGESFDLTIERELSQAKIVVVLWSRLSVSRPWVRNEARYAAERGVLAPATIDNVRLPLEYSDKQSANLVGWEGENDHHGFLELCASISAVMKKGPVETRSPTKNLPQVRVRSRVFRVSFVAPILIIFSLLVGFLLFIWIASRSDRVYTILTKAEELAVASGDSEQVEETLRNIQKAAGDFPNDGRFQKLLDETRKVKKSFQLRDKTYADLTAEVEQAAASGDATQVARLLNELQMTLQVFPDDRRFQKLLDEMRKVAGDLRDKTHADLIAEEKRAAASGDAAQLEKSLQSIQKAAHDFPDDGRFQKLLDETRKVASDLQLRNKTYADLAAAEKQAAASGDAAQVEQSVQGLQKAVGDFPQDGRFQKLLDETRKVASDLQLRDKTYADLAAAKKQAAASADAAQVEKSVRSIQKAVGDFPGDGRFQKLLDDARKDVSDLEMRDSTYASPVDAEKRAVLSGDASQVAKSAQSIQKAVGDFPGDGRFQKPLDDARKDANDLQRGTQPKPAATGPPGVPSRPPARPAPPTVPPRQVPPERVVRTKPQLKAAPNNNCFLVSGQRYCE